MLLSKSETTQPQRGLPYAFKAVMVGCLSSLCCLLLAPAASAADAACAGKAEGYFWSSTESSTAACDSSNFKSVCNKTFSNYCFGGNRLAISIAESCQKVACAPASSTPVTSTPVATTPVVTKPVVTTPAPVVTAPVVVPPVVVAPVIVPPAIVPIAPTPITTQVAPYVPGRLMLMGVGGHDNWTTDTYRASQTEAAFKLLAGNNIHVYRVDVEANQRGSDTLTRLLPIAKANNIILRPMLYVDNVTAATVETFVTRFAKDIKIWELGNELNLRGYDNFAANINRMKIVRQGVDAAAAKTGQNLETALNVTAWADGKLGINNAGDSYPFVDAAIASGLKFDIITYHYYPNANDRANGWMKKYLNPLRKYGKRVFLNETNCGEIYQGDDGNSDACKATAESLLNEVKLNYTDIISEITMYEMFDNTPVGGVEAHFGLLKNLTTPKKTFTMLSLQGAGTDASYLPVPSAAQKVVAAKLVTSSSANAAFVTLLFNKALNRMPDQSGLDYWTNRLDLRQTAKTDLVRAFVTGPEFVKLTASMDKTAIAARTFVTIMGRMATQAELKAAEAIPTQAALINNLMATAEFKKRMLDLN